MNYTKSMAAYTQRKAAAVERQKVTGSWAVNGRLFDAADALRLAREAGEEEQIDPAKLEDIKLAERAISRAVMA